MRAVVVGSPVHTVVMAAPVLLEKMAGSKAVVAGNRVTAGSAR